MVTLPPDFVSTRFPGYFWHIQEKALYSIKIKGVLRRLTPKSAWHTHAGVIPSGYDVSVNGRKRRYPIVELMKLEQHDSVVEVDGGS